MTNSTNRTFDSTPVNARMEAYLRGYQRLAILSPVTREELESSVDVHALPEDLAACEAMGIQAARPVEFRPAGWAPRAETPCGYCGSYGTVPMGDGTFRRGCCVDAGDHTVKAVR